MNALDNRTKTVKGRPFVSGDPRANVKGRPKGARGKRAAALLELLRPEGEKLLARAVALALDDKTPDPVVLRDLLGRLLPPPERNALVKFRLPEGVSLVEQSAAVLAAVAGGKLTPEEAARINSAIADHAKIVEAHELAERLSRLEARIGGQL